MPLGMFWFWIHFSVCELWVQTIISSILCRQLYSRPEWSRIALYFLVTNKQHGTHNSLLKSMHTQQKSQAERLGQTNILSWFMFKINDALMNVLKGCRKQECCSPYECHFVLTYSVKTYLIGFGFLVWKRCHMKQAPNRNRCIKKDIGDRHSQEDQLSLFLLTISFRQDYKNIVEFTVIL